MNTKGTLTRKQAAAVSALLTTRSVAEAAAASGVGRRTLYTWLAEDEAFRAALASAEEEALSHVVRRLCGLADKAVEALAGVLDDEKASASARTRAAEVVLSNLLKIRELRNTEERLAEIEERLDEID